MDQACSVKMPVCLIGLVLFCVFIDRDETQKHKIELGQYTAVLTSITHVYFDLTDDFWTKDQA